MSSNHNFFNDPVAHGRNDADVLNVGDLISFRLVRLVAVIDRRLHQDTVARIGLSLNEWRLLGVIAALAPTHAGAVADELLMDKSQASRLIKGLIFKKFILSRPDPADARAVVLRLSAKGRVRHQQMLEELSRRNTDLLQGLTAEQIAVLDHALCVMTAKGRSLLEDDVVSEKQNDVG